MGCCAAAPYEDPDNADSDTNKNSLKILFLGSGGCGKSTMFKQLRKLYGQGFTRKHRVEAINTIASFVVETMQDLLKEEKCNYEEFEDEKAVAAAKAILQVQTESGYIVELNKNDIATNLKILWALPEIKALFDETAKLFLNGPCAHFFDAIDRISASDYEPTDKDILMQRRPTTGLIEEKIAIADYDEVKFRMVDVGGQKNERRKWIHHFENVSAVCYVISLSAYDEPLFEDETKNSMQDALELFRETVNGESHWFKQSKLFLLFNKKDVFEQKIITKSLKECFGDDYDEDEFWNNCNDDQDKIDKNIQYIKQQFMDQINDKSKSVVTFETCAYEELDVQRVFPDILKNIVEANKSVGNIQ